MIGLNTIVISDILLCHRLTNILISQLKTEIKPNEITFFSYFQIYNFFVINLQNRNKTPKILDKCKIMV